MFDSERDLLDYLEENQIQLIDDSNLTNQSIQRTVHRQKRCCIVSETTSTISGAVFHDYYLIPANGESIAYHIAYESHPKQMILQSDKVDFSGTPRKILSTNKEEVIQDLLKDFDVF